MKIPRPDGEIEKLGLSILDEPKLNQSKRAVLDLMLAEHGKVHRKDYKEVHSIDNAHKNPREIQNWVNNVEKIISNRHAATVQYSSKMPDIDSLMQVKIFQLKVVRHGIQHSKMQFQKFKFQMEKLISQLKILRSMLVLF